MENDDFYAVLEMGCLFICAVAGGVFDGSDRAVANGGD